MESDTRPEGVTYPYALARAVKRARNGEHVVIIAERDKVRGDQYATVNLGLARHWLAYPDTSIEYVQYLPAHRRESVRPVRPAGKSDAWVMDAYSVCPECGKNSVTSNPDIGPLPVCLACDWTGWPEDVAVILNDHLGTDGVWTKVR